MSEIKESYVGVSGVTTPEMQDELEKITLNASMNYRGRKLLLGVKAIHRAQFEDKPVDREGHGPEWYPVGEEAFRGAISQQRMAVGARSAVAQAYFDLEYVGNAGYREFFLKRIQERGKDWIQGIQFDMLPWHTDDAMLPFLQHVKQSTGLDVYLQAHSPAMTELGPGGIISRLGAYASAVDYLLFDASHGTGKRLNTAALEPFLEEAYAAIDESRMGIAIAGGLDGNVVREELPALLEKFPNLSWDAEAKLHPLNAEGNRPIDLAVAEDYIRASASVLPERKRTAHDTMRAIIDAEIYWFGEIQRRPRFPYD